MESCVWVLETANTTCEKTAQGRMQETTADVLFLQELKVNEARLQECQGQAAKPGWSARYSAALRTSEVGHSGGTGVAARAGVGIREPEALPTDVEWHPSLETSGAASAGISSDSRQKYRLIVDPFRD